MTTSEVQKRADEYLVRRNLTFDSCLGVGTQGSVFVVNFPSPGKNVTNQVAVKFHEREIAYERELGVYLRLRDLEISHVGGHRVPQLVDYDDELLAIEMTIVSPPYCLDFGGAYLDRAPDYSPEVWADWREMKSDAFEENWPAVEKKSGRIQVVWCVHRGRKSREHQIRVTSIHGLTSWKHTPRLTSWKHAPRKAMAPKLWLGFLLSRKNNGF